MATTFLNLAKLESGRSNYDVMEINIVELLDDCSDLMSTNAAKEGLDLKKEYPQDLPPIHGDYDRIKQAIINLISNSIKYNRPGGDIILRSYSKEGNLFIEVEDTGIGIPKEHQERLFEKFYRVPGSETISLGTGLGLAVVKRIVEGHHGQIRVTSDQGIGTKFTITLSTF
jgi:signal transduction histidine kinase